MSTLPSKHREPGTSVPLLSDGDRRGSFCGAAMHVGLANIMEVHEVGQEFDDWQYF